MNNLSYENKFDLYENEHARETFSYEWFHTKTRFDTEAKDNSKWSIIKPPSLHYLSFTKVYFLLIISIHSQTCYENQDINHCVTRLFLRFRCLTGNLLVFNILLTRISSNLHSKSVDNLYKLRSVFTSFFNT